MSNFKTFDIDEKKDGPIFVLSHEIFVDVRSGRHLNVMLCMSGMCDVEGRNTGRITHNKQ